jgi:hypothetical protein
MLRKVDERTVGSLWGLIGMLVSTFKPHKCTNYFSSCEYDSE